MIVEQLGVVVEYASLLDANEGVVSTGQGLLLTGGLFFVAGLAVASFRGRRNVQNARRFLGAKPFDGNALEGSDSAAVAGPVTACDETEAVTGPLTGEECVLYEDETEKKSQEWKYDRDERREMKHSKVFDEEEREKKVTTWRTVALGREYVPFLVETEHGPVSVDPESAELDLPARAVEQPSLLRRALHRVPFVAYLGKHVRFVGNPSRRTERHVKRGDRILVVGDVDESDSNSDAVATVDGGSWLFVITTRSRRSLAARNLASALVASLPGLAFVLIGVVLLIVAAAVGVS